MLKRKQQNQLGFSIIEVVITLFMIGITLVLFQVTSNSVVINKYNRFKEVALRVAENELQSLRTTPYGSLPSSGSFTNSQLSSIPNGAGQINITELSDGFAEATVTVTWENPSASGTQQVELSTYLWQGGLGK